MFEKHSSITISTCHFLQCYLYQVLNSLIRLFICWLYEKAVFQHLKHFFSRNVSITIQVINLKTVFWNTNKFQVDYKLKSHTIKAVAYRQKWELYIVQHYHLSQIYHICAETLLPNTCDRQHGASRPTSIFYSAYSRNAYYTVCSFTDTLNYILGTHPNAVTSLTTFQMNLYSVLGMANAATGELWKKHAVILLFLLWFLLPHRPYFFPCCLKF